jgi:hypothetical protein
MKNNLKIKKNSLRVVISFTLSTLLLLILGFISLISVVSMILDNWNYLYILSTFLLISGLFFYFTQNKKLHKIRTIFFLIMVGAEVALFSFSIILINPNLLMIFFASFPLILMLVVIEYLLSFRDQKHHNEQSKFIMTYFSSALVVFCVLSLIIAVLQIAGRS